MLAWMPAYSADADAAYGMKILSIIPSNPTRGLDTHQGTVLLMDGLTGEVCALMNASAITAIRTAAVSAVATRRLARENARTLAIIGTGVQAYHHLKAILCVRPISQVRLVGRTPESSRRFVQRVQAEFSVTLEAAENAQAALRDADIVVTATSAREPVVQRDWLAPGTHINAVGACVPTDRELDTATLTAARLIVDCKESVENEAGEYRFALERGLIQRSHMQAELGEVLLDRVPGRTSGEEITLFRSLGLAIEDIAAAQYLLERARREGSGTTIAF